MRLFDRLQIVINNAVLCSIFMLQAQVYPWFTHVANFLGVVMFVSLIVNVVKAVKEVMADLKGGQP